MAVKVEGVGGSQIPISIHKSPGVALIDTGATKSCMSSTFYNSIKSNCTLAPIQTRVRGATGTSLKPLGSVNVPVQITDKHFEQSFIVCEALQRPIILGLDFLQTYKIGINWTRVGNPLLTINEVVVMTLETEDPIQQPIIVSGSYQIPARTMATIETNVDIPLDHKGYYHDSIVNREWQELNPSVYFQPMSYHTTHAGSQKIPITLINLEEEPLLLEKGEVVAFLEVIDPEVYHIETETVYKMGVQSKREIPLADIPYTSPSSDDIPLSEEERRMLVSPADVEVHRKIALKDAPVSARIKRQFSAMCDEFDDIFSKDSSDVGRTPLVTMEIPTGDHPPLVQRPYTLPLKHAEWVQSELDLLEKAGIIIRSTSPWASPIVIVPKRTSPDEPPRRRMCVDYRALNTLLPPIKKAFSNAKGVISLVPLPKIDEIYARLRGSQIFTTLDLRSGYHHIALSEESKPKTAFVVPTMGKFHYTMVPFGLAQAPAYFQRLIDEVLVGLPFAFGYLDDILIHSEYPEIHLDHLRTIFERLRAADLKLKADKCNFLKQHIQYLGHLVSSEGIEPLPEKLEAMEKMPAPTNPKEVRQFLGLTGYYRKFVPRYSDIAKPLTNLTKKDEPFVWTELCESTFQLLKQKLMESPILKYPDPNLPYILFTDASGYAWAGVLTQEHESIIEEKKVCYKHPITYVSGLFKNNQTRWAAMTKEAFAIYMCYKRLSYYLQDAEVTIYTDHLPLQKFLQKATLNSKVNNWAVEMEGTYMKIKHIAGIKNTLADTLSRLIQMDPAYENTPEPPGQEFGYNVFEQLPDIQVAWVTLEDILEVGEMNAQEKKYPLHTLNFSDESLKGIQKGDAFIQKILAQLEKKNMKEGEPYFLKEGVLHRYVVESGETYEVIVVPRILIGTVLKLAHDDLGHNGSTRTYMALKRLYYWKGMKTMIEKYVKDCSQCQQVNVATQKYHKMHFKVPTTPMEFISMDLIGEFHPVSSRGNRYALTAVCMLTGFTFCIPIPNKTAEEVVKAYQHQIYMKFGGSLKILTDNGTEFRNALFEEVATRLGVRYRPYSPPYHPQSNGRIEGFHRFLKAAITKHIAGTIEWDEVVDMACAAYNFMPNENSKESPFFLMFGRDPILPLNQLLKPRIRYMGDEKGLLSLESLQRVYQLAVKNLELARSKYDRETSNKREVVVTSGTRVMIKDHTAGPWEPKYKGDYRVVRSFASQVELKPVGGGKIRRAHITDLKYVLPADQIIDKTPKPRDFGRVTKLFVNLDKLPDLNWSWEQINQDGGACATPTAASNTRTTYSTSMRVSAVVTKPTDK